VPAQPPPIKVPTLVGSLDVGLTGLLRTLFRDVNTSRCTRYEQRTDMLLSTLQEYVEAMGGELDLIARFPNREPVRISALRDLSPHA